MKEISCPRCKSKILIDKDKKIVHIEARISSMITSVTCSKCRELIRQELR